MNIKVKHCNEPKGMGKTVSLKREREREGERERERERVRTTHAAVIG